MISFDSCSSTTSSTGCGGTSSSAVAMPDRDFNYTPSDAADRAVAKGGVACPFPWRLHEMLKVASQEGLEHIVSWAPHGKAFCVHKPQEFATLIMPRFFCQTKFASFQRQLNLYGFARFCHGRDKGAYYHACFIRGKRALVRQMIRRKIKGSDSCLRRPLPNQEPNFYQDMMMQQQQEGTVPNYISYQQQPPKTATATAATAATTTATTSTNTWTRNVSWGQDVALDDDDNQDDQDNFDLESLFEDKRFHVVVQEYQEEQTTTNTPSVTPPPPPPLQATTTTATEPMILDPAAALAKLRSEIRQKQAEYEQTVGQRYNGPTHTTTPPRRVSWQSTQSTKSSSSSSPPPAAGSIPVYKGSYIAV